MQVSNYGIEEIPDTARLYYRVHKNIYIATLNHSRLDSRLRGNDA